MDGKGAISRRLRQRSTSQVCGVRLLVALGKVEMPCLWMTNRISDALVVIDAIARLPGFGERRSAITIRRGARRVCRSFEAISRTSSATSCETLVRCEALFCGIGGP